MKNYYNKQRENTTKQIKYLYETKDVTFRGFRFSGGAVKENVPSKAFEKNTKNGNGSKKNNSIEGQKNWEGSITGDGDRFSQQPQDLFVHSSHQYYRFHLVFQF